MKLIIGLLLGFLLATSASIAQEWLDVDSGISPNPQILIPMPVYPAPYSYYPPMPYSLPPMTEPHWQSINPC